MPNLVPQIPDHAQDKKKKYGYADYGQAQFFRLNPAVQPTQVMRRMIIALY
jgi:hypothetical protein